MTRTSRRDRWILTRCEPEGTLLLTMAYRFVFLALPVVYARFEIYIHGAIQRTEPKGVNVSFKGDAFDIISDEERSSFGLSDQNIKDGVELYFGKRPNDVYLRSPTPYGDLYRTYEWEQVSRTLTALEGRVVNVASKPEMISQREFENHSTKNTNVNVSMNTLVDNKLSTSWSTIAKLTISKNTKLNIKFRLHTKYGSMNTDFDSNFFEDVAKIEPVAFGTTCSMNVTLQPGKSVVSELHAVKVVTRTELDYEASLEGMVAAHYAEKYKDHNFWALDIAAIMEYADLQNSILFQQIIVSEFYEQATLTLRDRDSGNLIFKGHICPDIRILV